jgi:hypothetical protein
VKLDHYKRDRERDDQLVKIGSTLRISQYVVLAAFTSGLFSSTHPRAATLRKYCFLIPHTSWERFYFCQRRKGVLCLVSSSPSNGKATVLLTQQLTLLRNRVGCGPNSSIYISFLIKLPKIIKGKLVYIRSTVLHFTNNVFISHNFKWLNVNKLIKVCTGVLLTLFDFTLNRSQWFISTTFTVMLLRIALLAIIQVNIHLNTEFQSKIFKCFPINNCEVFWSGAFLFQYFIYRSLLLNLMVTNC